MSDVIATPAASGATREARQRVPRYAWYVFWLMCGINFMNYADRWILTGLSGVLQTQFHLNDFQVGLIASAFLIVYTLVAVPMGFLAERTSRKAIVGVGVIIWSLATLLTGVAGSIFMLIFSRAIVGIGEGSYYPAGTPLLSAWFPPQRRSSVLAQWGTSALVGAGVGFLIADIFKGPTMWRYAFYLCAAPGLILGILIWTTRPRLRHELDPQDDGQAGRAPILQVTRACLRIPTVRVTLATHALGFFALTSLTAFLVLYLQSVYGPSSSFGAASISEGTTILLPGVLLLVGGIAGGLYGGAWANRLRRRRIGARVLVGGLGFLYAAPFVIATLAAPYILRALPTYTALAPKTQVTVGVIIFVVMSFGASFFLNVYNGPMSAALQDVLPPSLRAAGGGLELTLAHLLGDIYAAALVGALSDTLGAALGGHQIGLALLLTCPLALVGAGVVGIWGSRFYKADVEALGASAEVMAGV